MPNLLQRLHLLGDTGGWITDSAVITLLNPGVRACNVTDVPADLAKATNFAGGCEAPHIEHENWARHAYQSSTKGGQRRHMYCVVPRVAVDDAAGARRASRSSGAGATYTFPPPPPGFGVELVDVRPAAPAPSTAAGADEEEEEEESGGDYDGDDDRDDAGATARDGAASSCDENGSCDSRRTPDAKRRIRIKLTRNVTTYRAVRSRARVSPGELEPTQTPAATQRAGDVTARAARAGDVTAADSVRFRTVQGSWRVAQMAPLPPASAPPDEVRAALRAMRSSLATAQCEVARLTSEQDDGQRAASAVNAASFRNAIQGAAAEMGMGDGSAAELARLRIEVTKLTAEQHIERAAVASCDANIYEKESSQVTWLWRKRREREKLLLQNLENLHGGREGFEWCVIRLIRRLGCMFWMKLLMTDFFRRFTLATVNRSESRKASMEDKIKSLVSRERLVGVSVRAWERIASARERNCTMTTVLGPVRMVRRLLSTYMDEAAKYYIWSQDWCPKTYAGPELAVKYSSELGPLLAAEIAVTKIMMKDLSEYLAAIVKLCVEVDQLRSRLVWFLTASGDIKRRHFELGVEGDGFPPDCFELLLHVFNLHRFSEHMDLHFTILGGTISEKSSLLKALMRILDAEWKKVMSSGLDVELGAGVKRGSFIGCEGPGVHHFSFDGTGKGDLSWFGTASCNGTNSHTFCGISHDLNLKARPKIDATVSDHPRLTVERRCEQSAVVEEARSAAIRQQTSLEVAPLSHDSEVKIAAVGAAAAKAAAERAGNSQYNGPPLDMFLRSSQHDGMHLHCGLMETSLTTQVVNCLDDDGHLDRLDNEAIDIKNTVARVMGPSMTRMTDMLSRDMKLQRVAQNIRDMFSSDPEKRADAKKARLNGLAARVLTSQRYRFDDINGPPDRTWASVKRGAETLFMMLVASYMTICMRHRMTRVQLTLLTVIGAHIFALMAIFVVGSHRRRQIGLKEHVLCYFLPWCMNETFERFTYCDHRGRPSGFSLGGGVIGSVQSGERHHGQTKKRKLILGHDL